MIARGEKKQEKKTKTILVVDDEQGVREAISMVLRSAGYTVIKATDVESGWNEYRNAKPDLISLDLRMPGASGLTLLRRIREKDSLTPVIIITGYGSMDTAVEALKLGAYDYLSKPFDVKRLLGEIERLLGRSALELKAHHSSNLIPALTKENEALPERLKELPAKPKRGLAGKDSDKLRAICAAAAHNLRNQFLSIGASIKVLQERGRATPDMKEKLEMIGKSLEYSEIILRRLLDYLDIGKPQLKPVDALDLLRRTESLARPRLPATIQLGVKVDESVKAPIVSANVEQLIGILLELVDNAVEAIREKKGGTIQLHLEGRNGTIAISVKDDGPGIPLELRRKLFKKPVSSKGGLGLGLYLCNKVISALGGRLNLEASSEKGTTFTILLPQARDK